MTAPKVLASAVIAGLGAFTALFAAVWLTGSTFGQRCEALGHEWGGAQWEICVSALAKGPANEPARIASGQ